MLRVQILVKNNERTIRQTLTSIEKLNAEIYIGNIGCKDHTLTICREFDAKIIDIPWERDWSKARNRLVGPDWNLFLHPWEVLVNGHEEITKAKKPGVFRFQVFQEEIITKEIRYWHGEKKFIHPVYETIDEKAVDASAIIYSIDPPDQRKENLDLVIEWSKRKETNSEPLYYMAFAYLSLRKYREFKNAAERFLLKETSSMSAIMLRYYLALSQLHVDKDLKNASRNLLACVTAHPLMAEFWCGLGDIFYKNAKFDKAKAMYQNAIILGSRRSNEDGWPIEIAKYGQYPEGMIHNIIEMKKRTRVFGSK